MHNAFVGTLYRNREMRLRLYCCNDEIQTKRYARERYCDCSIRRIEYSQTLFGNYVFKYVELTKEKNGCEDSVS